MSQPNIKDELNTYVQRLRRQFIEQVGEYPEDLFGSDWQDYLLVINLDNTYGNTQAEH